MPRLLIPAVFGVALGCTPSGPTGAPPNAAPTAGSTAVPSALSADGAIGGSEMRFECAGIVGVTRIEPARSARTIQDAIARARDVRSRHLAELSACPDARRVVLTWVGQDEPAIVVLRSCDHRARSGRACFDRERRPQAWLEGVPVLFWPDAGCQLIEMGLGWSSPLVSNAPPLLPKDVSVLQAFARLHAYHPEYANWRVVASTPSLEAAVMRVLAASGLVVVPASAHDPARAVAQGHVYISADVPDYCGTEAFFQ